MLTEIYDITKIRGHTVETCLLGEGQMLLVFDDGTFTTFGIEAYHDDPPDIIHEPFNRGAFRYSQLSDAGVCTMGELEEMIAKEKWIEQEQTEKLERETYEKLKRKYGGN